MDGGKAVQTRRVPRPVYVAPYVGRDATWRYGLHAHASAEIDLVVEGACELWVPGGARLSLRAGDAFVVPPLLPHAFTAGERGCAFAVVLVRGLPEAVFQHVTPGGLPARYPLSPAGRRTFAGLVGTIEHEMALADELADEVTLALAVQLAALIVRDSTRAAGPLPRASATGEAHVQRALTLIGGAHLAATDVGGLAADLHLSPSHLRRLFRRHLGVSPRTYLARRRLDLAKGLLVHTDLSVAAIARQVGFANPQHFTAFFTRGEGASPAVSRRQRRLPVAVVSQTARE